MKKHSEKITHRPPEITGQIQAGLRKLVTEMGLPWEEIKRDVFANGVTIHVRKDSGKRTITGFENNLGQLIGSKGTTRITFSGKEGSPQEELRHHLLAYTNSSLESPKPRRGWDPNATHSDRFGSRGKHSQNVKHLAISRYIHQEEKRTKTGKKLVRYPTNLAVTTKK